MRLKRYHFAARGRTRPYKRRTSHIRVILTDNSSVITKKPATTENTEKLTEGTVKNSDKTAVAREGSK